MTQVSLDRMVSMTEASNKLSAVVDDTAEHGYTILMRRNAPVAAVVSMSEFTRWQDDYEDTRDWLLALSRVITDDGNRTSFNDVLDSFGYSREDLEATTD